jgi:hypothetical protein
MAASGGEGRIDGIHGPDGVEEAAVGTALGAARVGDPGGTVAAEGGSGTRAAFRPLAWSEASRGRRSRLFRPTPLLKGLQITRSGADPDRRKVCADTVADLLGEEGFGRRQPQRQDQDAMGRGSTFP